MTLNERAEAVRKAAMGELGSPYVYGTWGQKCTTALRKKYANYNPDQKEITYRRCQVLREKDPKPGCAGCLYEGRLAFDCRGFTHWCLETGAGIDIYGQKVSVQYATAKNWDEKGPIDEMPDLVCCVFLDGHTGLHLGGGLIVHCSGEVKQEQLGQGRKWVKYAIPKGLYTAEEINQARGNVPLETIKRGSRGEAVRKLQTLLNAKGYDCGAVDGIFGVKTERALRRFQEVNGLDPDGICGADDWDALVDQPELPEDDDEIPEIPVITEDPGEGDEWAVGPEPDGQETVRFMLGEMLDHLDAMRSLVERLNGTLR